MAESLPTPLHGRRRRSSMDIPLSFSIQSEVLCDICEEEKQKALKSCLVCQSSYCETHLQRHLKVEGLKTHKLMEPLSNLKDYICQKHKRPLELFCRDDQTCVCLMCTVTDHKSHNTVPLEEESEEKKTQLMKQMIQDRKNKIQDIKRSAEVRKRNTEKEKAFHVEHFIDLVQSIERCQTELLEIMEERRKAAEKQEQELIEDLEQEITELEQLSHTENHIQFLQIYPSLCSPTKTKSDKNWPEIRTKAHESQEYMSSILTKLQDTLNEKCTLTDLKWKRQYAVDVTLDPDTAHHKLILSNDGKQVRHQDTEQKLPDNPKRFNTCPSVLGKEGFSSERFYFEVQVKEKTGWTLGVARESTNRKGNITLSPEDGYWTVALRNGDEYKACADPPVSLRLKVKPQQVGVFVDYEEGLVSFYDVESSSLIHSYTDQSFSGKLYPYFSPGSNNGGQNSAPLVITKDYKTPKTQDSYSFELGKMQHSVLQQTPAMVMKMPINK